MANLRADNLTGTGGRNAIDGSVFFGTTTTDWLKVGSAGDFNFLHNGESDFTAEFWVKPGLGNSRQSVFSTGGNSSTVGFTCRIMEDGATGGSNGYKVLVQYSRGASGNYLCFLGGTLTVGEWAHVALVFTTSNKQLAVYVNGQLTNSSDLDGSANGTFGSGNFASGNSTNSLQIGREPYGTTMYLHGSFVSNLRIVEGVTVYTAAFTPPTEKLTVVDGTVLLCCQDSDDPTQEATGKTITGYGNYYGNTTTNLITNGDFGTGDLTGWTTDQATTSVVSGSARIVPDSSVNGALYQQFTTVAGKQYKATMRVTNTPTSNYARLHLGTGTDIDSANKYLYSGGDVQNVGQGTYSLIFTPTGTTTTLWLEVGGGTQVTTDFDDISVVGHNVGPAPKVLPPVGVDEGVVFDGDMKMNSQGVMYFPTGDTSQRGRGRGLIIAGYTNPLNIKTTDYVQIQSLGNAIKFGDATALVRGQDAAGSSTRAVSAGGFVAPGIVDTIEYFTTATTSNAVDFGNLVSATSSLAGFGNETRGIWAGGYVPSASDKIDYVTIASTGNAADFGNCVANVATAAGCASPTRGVFGGGYASPAGNNTLQYVTIATTGNATDFGDLTAVTWGLHALSSNTRGVFGGGVAPSITNTISYVTIASTGNAADFGDLIQTASYHACTSNGSRGIFAGGDPTSTFLNTIQYVTIATTGNASDFGDMTTIGAYRSATSDSHGGLS